jgi:hypothetical protein
MEENESNSKHASLKEKIRGSRLLLTKYFVLSPFAQIQLKNFPLVCCDIAISGKAEVDLEGQTVTYFIATKRYFYYKGHKTIAKRNFIGTFFYKWIIWEYKYRAQIRDAKRALSAWSKELLWGEETIVNIDIDGERVQWQTKTEQ